MNINVHAVILIRPKGVLFLFIVAPFLFASADVLEIRSTRIKKAMIAYSIIVTAAFWFADRWLAIAIVAGIGLCLVAKPLYRYIERKKADAQPSSAVDSQGQATLEGGGE